MFRNRDARAREVDIGTNLPRHVAIIMDGNGRWAKKRGLPRALGHKAGSETAKALIYESAALGIESLTLYTLSTENYIKRSKEEVGVLMGLIIEYIEKELERIHSKGIRGRFLGDMDALPAPQREAAMRAMDRTKHNAGMWLNFALNYGGRAEIARAARLVAQDVQAGVLTLADIDEQAIAARLYTAGLPDVDLLIRTGGDFRLSNFLPFQSTYAELMVFDTLWPDFDLDAYHGAIKAFGSRERRFGGRPGEA